jgi:hypothetical protein
MEPIDLSNSEDWSKAMYHNYITLLKRVEADTGIPINYIPLYIPSWEVDGWRFDPNFKRKFDDVKEGLTD